MRHGPRRWLIRGLPDSHRRRLSPEQLLGVICVAFLLTIVGPALIAWSDDVLCAEQVRSKLLGADTLLGVRKAVRGQRDQMKSFETKLAAIDARRRRRFASNADVAIDSLLKLEEDVRAKLKRSSERLRLVGYLESNVSYYFLAAYLGMLLHLALSVNGPGIWHARVRLRPAMFALYVLWMGSNWARNLMPDDSRRRIFSYVNLDVSCPSFVYQECLSFAFAVITVHSWSLWSDEARRVEEEIDEWRSDDLGPKGLYHRASYVGQIFDRWQVHAALVAFAFLPWTLFYWSSKNAYGDSRYYLSAAALHVIWGLTMFAISRPALQALRAWRLEKQRALAKLVAGASHGGRRADDPLLAMQIEFARQVEPIAVARVVVAGGGSLIAFLIPLLPLIASIFD